MSNQSQPLHAAKQRLLREARDTESEALRRVTAASTSLQVGSAALGLIMGHRGARRFAVSAIDALCRLVAVTKPSHHK